MTYEEQLAAREGQPVTVRVMIPVLFPEGGSSAIPLDVEILGSPLPPSRLQAVLQTLVEAHDVQILSELSEARVEISDLTLQRNNYEDECLKLRSELAKARVSTGCCPGCVSAEQHARVMGERDQALASAFLSAGLRPERDELALQLMEARDQTAVERDLLRERTSERDRARALAEARLHDLRETTREVLHDAARLRQLEAIEVAAIRLYSHGDDGQLRQAIAEAKSFERAKKKEKP